MNVNNSDPIEFLDDEAVTKYLRHKLPDWHMRLRAIEKEQKEFRETMNAMADKMDNVHTAILGSTDGEKRGILRRLEIVETWKSAASWVGGVLFVAFVGCIVTIILKN